MDNTFRIYPIGIQNFEQLRNNNVYVDKTELKMQDAIYVFEFKVDHRKVMKVGVNFDSVTRTIGEWRAMED